MKEQLIISVSREFGSGGHEIAQRLADHYQIPLLDNNLLQEIAQEKNLDVQKLHGLDEKKKVPGLSRTVRGISSSLEENITYLQFDYLKKKAAKGDSFVIVGRCSDEILKGSSGLITMFILGDQKCKTERIMERYQLDEREAKRMIREKDTERQRYHNSFCKGKWGDSSNYDISINSSKTGIDGAVKFLINYIDLRRNASRVN